MPLLFSLEQHNALHAVQETLLPNERIFAFLDDVCGLFAKQGGCNPHVVGERVVGPRENRVHAGNTKIFNRAGERPEACDHLERIARTMSEEARVWRRGADIPEVERGIKVLGTPLGHPVFVQHQLARVRAHQQVLLDRIPAIPDVQSAWALLSHCAAARATCFIRVPPECASSFARSHDTALWECLCRVLDVPPDSCEGSARAVSQLPLAFGGLDCAAQNAPELLLSGLAGRIL